jgi:anti-sigma-K factor RskA
MQEDHRYYAEELAAYLLDALSAEEARAFEQHLAGCSRCQAEERWLRAAVAILPSSVEQVEPPPAIRDRLMETIRAESAAASKPERERTRRRARLGFVLRPATAAVAAGVVAVAGLAGYLIGQDGGTDTTTVSAQATPAAPGAKAEVVRSGDMASLRVERLPVPPPRRVYEVWLVRKGSSNPQPSTLFVVRRSGTGEAAIPGSTNGVKKVLVTEEPAGGSKKPTTEPLLSATL